MRPRSSVKLVLVSTLPLALTACGQPSDTVSLLVKTDFSSLRECAETKVPMEICSGAYSRALGQYRKVAPSYGDQASCEADYSKGYCVPSGDKAFVPRMDGFELAVSGTLSWADYEKTAAESIRPVSHTASEQPIRMRSQTPLDLMISEGADLQYYSEPIDERCKKTETLYNTTSHRNFSRGSSSSSGSSIMRSIVSPSTSRGGFGQQATARSGWSGRSSSGFSFGG